MGSKTLKAGDFARDWTIVREIVDRSQKQLGDFEGEAVLRPTKDAGVLHYAERGDIRLGDGPQMEATRAYLWQFGRDKVEVAFTDGRPFHTFQPRGRGAGTEHLCGSDLYRVEYDFSSWPRWRATWKVSGPRKDYTSVSEYTPAG